MSGLSLNGTGLSLGATDQLATSLAGGSANQLAYQSAANVTAFVTAPTIAGTSLQWSGSAFVWATGEAAASVTVGTTTVLSGTSTRILYNNAGVLGEYTLIGSGTVVVMQTSPTLITPAIGVATGTSLALGGATIGTNALAVTGTIQTNAGATFGGYVNVPTGAGYYWAASTVLSDNSTNGQLKVTNSTGTAGILLDVITDGTAKFRNRANSADAAISALTGAFSGNVTLQDPATGSMRLRLSAAGSAAYYTDIFNNVGGVNAFEIQHHGNTILKASSDGYASIQLGNTANLILSASGGTAVFNAVGLTLTTFANTTAYTVNGYSLTGANAQSLLDLSGTWNTTGVPTLIKANVTNTASGAGSLLMDLQVAGVSKFSVDPAGFTTSQGLGLANGSGITFNNYAQIAPFGVGQVVVRTAAGTAGTLLDVSTDAIAKFRNRANTGDAAITAGAATFSGAVTVPGSTTAALTSTATFTSGAGAQAGTLTNAPAAGNPTSWIKIVDNGVTRYIPAW